MGQWSEEAKQRASEKKKKYWAELRADPEAYEQRKAGIRKGLQKKKDETGSIRSEEGLESYRQQMLAYWENEEWRANQVEQHTGKDLEHAKVCIGVENGCIDKRHFTVNDGQFQVGGEAGPGWAKNVGRGWTDEERAKSGRMTGKKQTNPNSLAQGQANMDKVNARRRHNYLHSGYGPEWTHALRVSIRERDGNKCVLCGELQARNKLVVHHVDYNKANCDPLNLVTVCRKCHGKGHTHDEWPDGLYTYLDNLRNQAA